MAGRERTYVCCRKPRRSSVRRAEAAATYQTGWTRSDTQRICRVTYRLWSRMPVNHVAGVGIGTLLALWLVAVAPGASASGESVSFCHRTNSVNNPYNVITTDADSIIK